MKIGTLTTGAGVVTTFNLNYIPEVIYFNAGTAITGLVVNVLDLGIITDLDAEGLKSMGSYDMFAAPSSQLYYKIPLADGVIWGRNVEIRITNSAAQTPDIYVGSNNRGGTGYMTNLRQKVFGSTPVDVEKFALLGLGNASNGDKIDITYQDGTVQTYEVAELPYLMAERGYFPIATVSGKTIYNRDGSIKSVRFTPVADQTIYIQRAVFTLKGQ